MFPNLESTIHIFSNIYNFMWYFTLVVFSRQFLLRGTDDLYRNVCFNLQSLFCSVFHVVRNTLDPPVIYYICFICLGSNTSSVSQMNLLSTGGSYQQEDWHNDLLASCSKPCLCQQKNSFFLHPGGFVQIYCGSMCKFYLLQLSKLVEIFNFGKAFKFVA